MLVRHGAGQSPSARMRAVSELPDIARGTWRFDRSAGPCLGLRCLAAAQLPVDVPPRCLPGLGSKSPSVAGLAVLAPLLVDHQWGSVWFVWAFWWWFKDRGHLIHIFLVPATQHAVAPSVPVVDLARCRPPLPLQRQRLGASGHPSTGAWLSPLEASTHTLGFLRLLRRASCPSIWSRYDPHLTWGVGHGR